MASEIPFEPFPFLNDPHYQTIINGFFNLFLDPPSLPKIVKLPDGDCLSLEITTPEGWRGEDLTVLLVHGLCGSHQSPNLVRMTRRLTPLGIRVVRYNMRSCGSGFGMAKRIYHSGRSDDIFEAIQALKTDHPNSPIVLIGFSLGGNQVLKLGGELGCIGGEFVKKIIAVSPPTNLKDSAERLADPKNRIYERYFYLELRRMIHALHRMFRDLPRIVLPRNLKLYEFDDFYTAPVFGFQDSDDYYNKCSSKYYVSEISVPCKVLFAQDDPIISASALDDVDLPSNIDIFKTRHGGHMGYLGNFIRGKGFYWLDSLLLDWIMKD